MTPTKIMDADDYRLILSALHPDRSLSDERQRVAFARFVVLVKPHVRTARETNAATAKAVERAAWEKRMREGEAAGRAAFAKRSARAKRGVATRRANAAARAAQ